MINNKSVYLFKLHFFFLVCFSYFSFVSYIFTAFQGTPKNYVYFVYKLILIYDFDIVIFYYIVKYFNDSLFS